MSRLTLALWLLVVAVFMLLGIWVVQDNPDPATVHLLGFPLGDLPLGLWLLSVFFVGAGAGFLSSSVALLRLQRRIQQYRRHLSQLRATAADRTTP